MTKIACQTLHLVKTNCSFKDLVDDILILLPQKGSKVGTLLKGGKRLFFLSSRKREHRLYQTTNNTKFYVTKFKVWTIQTKTLPKQIYLLCLYRRHSELFNHYQISLTIYALWSLWFFEYYLKILAIRL